MLDGYDSHSPISREDVLPVRLYNASISLDNPLLYPPGIAIVDPFPNTKAALRELTSA
jgi:hypothetical protein